MIDRVIQFLLVGFIAGISYGLGTREGVEPEKFLPSPEYKETTSHFLCHQDRYRCRIYILKEPLRE